MLKPYKVYTYVSVDDEPKRQLWYAECGLTEDEPSIVIEKSFTFQEALVHKWVTPYITTGTTFFLKRPYVKIEYSWCSEDKYYSFERITLERRVEPWNNPTLKDIHDCSTADQFIQYLKERGITTCPMNF